LLVVKTVQPDGQARVLYAIDDEAASHVLRMWVRPEAKIVDDTLTLTGPASITYTLARSGTLQATTRVGIREPTPGCPGSRSPT